MEAIRTIVAGLRPGEVIHVPRTRRRGLAVVLSSRDGKPTVLSEDRSYFRLSAKDFDDPPTVLTRIVLPRSGSSRSARYRRDVASKLVSLHVKRPREARHPADPAVEEKAKALEERAAEHPCAACPERAKHERWAVRADTLEAQLKGVQRRIQIRTETLARQFDRVLAVLQALGLRRRLDHHAEGTNARAHLRRGRPAGGGVALVGAVRRSLAPGARVAGEHRGLRIARTRAVARASCPPAPRGTDTSSWSARTGGSGGPRRSIRSSSAARSTRGSPRPSSTGPRASRSRTCWRRPRWRPATSSGTASS